MPYIVCSFIVTAGVLPPFFVLGITFISTNPSSSSTSDDVSKPLGYDASFHISPPTELEGIEAETWMCFVGICPYDEYTCVLSSLYLLFSGVLLWGKEGAVDFLNFLGVCCVRLPLILLKSRLLSPSIHFTPKRKEDIHFRLNVCLGYIFKRGMHSTFFRSIEDNADVLLPRIALRILLLLRHYQT